MLRIITIIAAVMTILSATAETYSYRFNCTPLPKAVMKILDDHPELEINFIYNELENYKTNATVNTDDAYCALRQIIGLNPVTLVRSRNTYYLEALQHGKYVYTGKAVGTDSEPVVAATVMLLAPKDSTVLTYGITDEAGRFSIPCDRQGVIAKLSCVGYKTLYRKFDSFNTGTILMTELPVKLKALTVEGENSTLLSDRTIFRPTQRQKHASQTAIDLLRYMAIAQISINLVDESVTTLTGDAVAIYVNGLPASSAELSGMRTADVKTIEYLDFPTDPRFNGNEHVINFIMQKYEYGGYTKLSESGNILIGLSNRASLYSKFTYKSMIYDVYAGASNLDIRHSGVSQTGEYTLKEVDGKDLNVIRREGVDKSHLKSGQYPVSLRAVYDSDKIQIGNTVGVSFDKSSRDEAEGSLSFIPSAGTDYSYKTNQPSTTRHLVWSGAYIFILPNGFQLNLSPGANYGHTDYSYSYVTSLPGSMTIMNDSREDYYRMDGGASIYKSFSQHHAGLANIYAGTNRNKVTYTGSSPYVNDFTDSYAGVQIGYSYMERKWKLDTNVALQWERNGINGESASEIYPLINISARYTPSNHHSIQMFFHYGANYPGESVKSPNILQENELMYKTGNPDLPLSRQITLNAQYNLMVNNRFSISVFSQYFGESNLYVPMYEIYKDGSAILKTYTSDQDYHRTKIGLSFNWKLLDGNLQLAGQPSVSVFRYRGYYNMTKNPVMANVSATYYLNRFFIQASYQTANKTIQGNLGVWFRDRDFYQLQVGWGNANWNIRLSAVNMFRGDWTASTQTISAPLYSETLSQRGTYYHRRLNLSATYTFGYGKKVNRGNEVGEQYGGSSAILK